MNVGYIKQEKKPITLINKIKYYLGLLTIEQLEHSYCIHIPVKDKEIEYLKQKNIEIKEVNRKEKNIEKRLIKIINRITKFIEKNNVNIIIFATALANNKETVSFESYFKEILEKNDYLINETNQPTNNINILTGKKIMKYMQYEILEYILKAQNKKIIEEDVYFLIKKESSLDLSFLGRFIQNAKTVNVVTDDIERFKKVQENIYEKENILISVSNNKNKALKRAKYIFNVNMKEKDLNKLKMNRDVILIHLENYIKYCKGGFEGINVNTIKLKIPDEYIEEFEKIDENVFEKFELIKLYEAKVLQNIHRRLNKTMIQLESNICNMQYDIANEIIKKDNTKIVKLIGTSGEISIKEIVENARYIK